MNVSTKKNKIDLKCIWMLAGIVNYRLCDQDFNCDDCKFNKVMQGAHYQPIADDQIENQEQNNNDPVQKLVNQYLEALYSGCKIHLDRCYYPSHLWCQVIADDCLFVGIDKIIIKILKPVEQLILPQKGDTYHENQLIAWIVRKGKTFPLHSPVNGEVAGINPHLISEGFEQVVEDDSYLFTMKGNGIYHKVQQICGSMQGLQSYLKKMKVLRTFITDTLQENLSNDLGITLADGGLIHTELEKVIGEQALNKLSDNLFRGR